MSQYVICVDNEGYPVSLELFKVYRTVADAKAESHNQLRVIDESGEDYLYPARRFVVVDLPPAAVEAMERQPA